MPVRERPIVMTAESVRGILSGAKTQTRRVIKPQPQENWVDWLFKHHGNRIFGHNGEPQLWLCDDNGKEIKFPYGKPGDRLYVKETWATVDYEFEYPGIAVRYRADPGCTDYWCSHEWIGSRGGDSEKYMGAKFNGDWRSPIFMPRWASRIALEITGVKVERVQDISDDDAIAEGVWTAAPELMASEMNKSYIGAYRQLWDSINLSRGFGWESNVWVWAISFKRITP